MKCKVRLTYEVELIVEGNSEDAIMDWLYATTPAEAIALVDNPFAYVYETYDEEILSYADDDDIASYVIKEEEDD